MSPIDQGIVFAFVLWILYDGLRHARAVHKDPTHWFQAGGRARGFVIGLSIMATQASAITLVGTTGKGFEDGTGFVQFYYSLPLAMAILAFVFVPFYQRMRAATAYEWIERRHGRAARRAVAGVFLLQRGLALGVVLSVPARVLTHQLELPYEALVLGVAFIAVLYTAVGGVAAVLSTDVKQMAILVLGLLALFWSAFQGLPAGVGALEVAELSQALGQFELLDLEFNPSDPYNLWSSLFGATVVFLAYFGTDQSQVQRWLAGRDVKAQRGALWLNAWAKVPLQFAILFLGLVFSFGVWADPLPLFLSPEKQREAVQALPELPALEARYAKAQRDAHAALQAYGAAPTPSARKEAFEATRVAAQKVKEARAAAEESRKQKGLAAKPESNDIIPFLLRHRLPIGMVGLVLIAIFAAALSSVDSELSALGAVAAIDLCGIPIGDPKHARRLLLATRLFTGLAGLIAALFALSLAHERSVVEQVNALGSWFYGALLGVFLLSIVGRRPASFALITALLAGLLATPILEVLRGADSEPLAFLWRSTIGFLVSFGTGFGLSLFKRLQFREHSA